MKAFEVGDAVYRMTARGAEEGRVESFSSTGASMRVRWKDGRLESFAKGSRGPLMTWVDMARLRDKRALEDEARAAKADYQAAVTRLTWAVDDSLPVGGDPLYVLRQTTTQLEALTKALTTKTKGVANENV